MAVAGRGGSVAGELGDCFFGAGIVDEVLAVGGGGDERGDSGVVEGTGQPVGDAVQPGDRVVGAANMPIRSCRLKVGCPARMAANGEAESISEFVKSLSSSSWSGCRR